GSEDVVRRIHDSGGDIERQVTEYVQLLASAPGDEERLEGLRARMREVFPARALIAPQALDSDAVRTMVVSAERTALLSYLFTDQSLVIRAFGPDGRSWFLSLAVGNETLVNAVVRVVQPLYQGRVTVVSTARDRASASAELAKLILTPLPSELWQG